jgi:hypothetical protein
MTLPLVRELKQAEDYLLSGVAVDSGLRLDRNHSPPQRERSHQRSLDSEVLFGKLTCREGHCVINAAMMILMIVVSSKHISPAPRPHCVIVIS